MAIGHWIVCDTHFVNAHECASPAADSIGFAKIAPVWKLNNNLLNLPSQHNFASFLCALSCVSHLLALQITLFCLSKAIRQFYGTKWKKEREQQHTVWMPFQMASSLRIYTFKEKCYFCICLVKLFYIYKHKHKHKRTIEVKLVFWGYALR